MIFIQGNLRYSALFTQVFTQYLYNNNFFKLRFLSWAENQHANLFIYGPLTTQNRLKKRQSPENDE